MTVLIYKVCSCCAKEYESREDFIKRTVLVGPWVEAGLTLYNCDCGSTLTIETSEGSKEAARMLRIQKRLLVTKLT